MDTPAIFILSCCSCLFWEPEWHRRWGIFPLYAKKSGKF